MGKKNEGKKDRDIELTVGTPKGPFTAAFKKTAKVIDVILAAISTKGLAGESEDFEIFFGDTELTPTTRPLVSFGLEDGDKLLLTAQGDGV
ncbi:hypothetical protein [Euryhalocaulis caribicus]|uniref:hypothetical protein n=1 Tax=Euryhalocaulis caribicus TaxID=1161401 RepID=UPI0003B6D88F|nr:hypothetical protein [Euryhalocaulis caribicus]